MDKAEVFERFQSFLEECPDSSDYVVSLDATFSESSWGTTHRFSVAFNKSIPEPSRAECACGGVHEEF